MHLKVVSPKEVQDYEMSQNQMSVLLKEIPEQEKNKVYYYEVVTSIYPLMQIDANYKYFVFQEWHGEIDPDIYNNICKMMAQEKPLWVVTQTRGGGNEDYLSSFQNKDFVKILKKNYYLHMQNGSYLLYKLDVE